MLRKLKNYIKLKVDVPRYRADYLDLIESSLTGTLYLDKPIPVFGKQDFDPEVRAHGLDWPVHAQTMIGTKRMQNLRFLVEEILRRKIPGDLIETGVWRGGACIYMRAILHAHRDAHRCVFVADSFAGLPEPDPAFPADAESDFHTFPQLAVTLEDVQENFRRYNLLDSRVIFLKGWFKDTLPMISSEQFALLRLDGDMYESTIQALENLYHKLSVGGFVIIDDYCVVPACKQATDEFRTKNNIAAPLTEIDGVGVYWQKEMK